MTFTIPCSTFARISAAALQPTVPDRQPPKPAIRSVRLEHHKGVAFAIATNRLVCVIERIGEVPEAPDAAVNVSLDLVDPAIDGARADAVLEVNVSGGWAVATMTNGYFHPNNVAVDGEFPAWRDLIPKDVPKRPIGAIAFVSNALTVLTDTAPSGEIVLPRHYDALHPLIVRDLKDPNWLAVFYSIDGRAQAFEPATVPDWAKFNAV